ncbi:MAG: hypothetical protein LBT09_10865 [Planctomycetaceae bacterium]|jgi:hypothetical protein|nr:hypothetical protein [Planctomycetaceae bacterium]
MSSTIIPKICERYRSIYPYLDERAKRMWVANAAWSIGRGGINTVHQAADVNRKTIRLSIKQLDHPIELPHGRCRQSGGGRKKITETNQQLLSALNHIIEPDLPTNYEHIICPICNKKIPAGTFISNDHNVPTIPGN